MPAGCSRHATTGGPDAAVSDAPAVTYWNRRLFTVAWYDPGIGFDPRVILHPLSKDRCHGHDRRALDPR